MIKKLKIYEGVKNIHDTKIIKNSKRAIVISGLVLSNLLTGCGSNYGRIGNSYSIDEVIESFKDETTMDENLDVIDLPVSKSENISWDVANYEYRNARKNEDIALCNKYSGLIQKMVLECKLLDSLNFDLNKILDFKFNIKKESNEYFAIISYKVEGEEVVPGNISITRYDEYEKKFKLVGLAEVVADNLFLANNGKLTFNGIDNAYMELELCALGIGKVSSDRFIVSYPSEKKINSCEKIIMKLRRKDN